jgi:hypothetical protein
MRFFTSDPDPTFNVDANDSLSDLSLWIRIRLLIKVMRICNYWPEDRPSLHSKPPLPTPFLSLHDSIVSSFLSFSTP